MKDKLLSGRLYLTIICGMVFAWAVFQGSLSPEATTGILVMVFNSYFQRSDRKGVEK